MGADESIFVFVYPFDWKGRSVEELRGNGVKELKEVEGIIAATLSVGKE
jgi:hypothetical protein